MQRCKGRVATKPKADDQIAVGAVGDGAAVAVGRGARAIRIGRLHIDARLWPVVVLLVIIIGALLYLLLRPKVPRAMTGEFNVAVAEIIVVDQDGRPVRCADGRALADFLYQRLEGDFAELGLQGVRYELWPPAYTGRIGGATRDERAQAAETRAQQIGAHVLIYGAITQAGDHSQFAPEFYINYRGFEEAEEIAGQYELGSALRIVLPFDPDEFQGVENPALTARMQVLSLIAIGLSYDATDDYERALDYFTRAEAVEGWLPSAGKEIVYLLLGNAEIGLASKEKSAEYLPTAFDYYVRALSINPTCARAKVGQAGTLYLMALGDPAADPSFATVDLERLDEAAAAYQAALSLDAPESANIAAKVHFGLGQVYFARAAHAIAGGGDRATPWAQAQAEWEQVVQEYEGGNTRLADRAGHAYARLGMMARMQGERDTAIAHYERAIELVTPFYQAYYYTRLGEVYADGGQTDRAVECYEEAIRIAEFYGDAESAEKYSVRLSELQSGE